MNEAHLAAARQRLSRAIASNDSAAIADLFDHALVDLVVFAQALAEEEGEASRLRGEVTSAICELADARDEAKNRGFEADKLRVALNKEQLEVARLKAFIEALSWRAA